MPVLSAFNGIRYASSGELADLVCPPYDVIGPEEQTRLYARHPHNAVRVELPFSGEGSIGDRYGGAAEHFGTWLEEGVLRQDEVPCLYVYRQDFRAGEARRSVTGVIGALRLEPFGAGAGVLPHERTMPGPIEDRLALLHACPVNISPIYAIYRGEGSLSQFLESLEGRPTEARFSDDSGTLHRLWIVKAPAEVELLEREIGRTPLVIADGHHRYETALAFSREQGGRGGHDSVMCFCVDADAEDLVVLPYHRVVRTSESPEVIQRRAAAAFAVGPAAGPHDTSVGGHVFDLVLPHTKVRLTLDRAEVTRALSERASDWRKLDVVVLHEIVLPQLFGDSIDEMRFSKDAGEIERLVGEGGWDAGILLQAMDATDVVDVARSGERLPQKASYFWPKALTGLVFRSLR